MSRVAPTIASLAALIFAATAWAQQPRQLEPLPEPPPPPPAGGKENSGRPCVFLRAFQGHAGLGVDGETLACFSRDQSLSSP